MSVTSITKCRSLIATVTYLTKEQENNPRDRVASMYCSLGSLDRFTAMGQQIKEIYGRETVAFNLVQSFPADEFDRDNPDDIQRVNDLGFELCQKLYPNSPCLIVTHNDSEGGCLHNHIAVLNHDFETEGCITANRKHKQVAYHNDLLMKEHGLRVCEPAKERKSQAEHHAVENQKYSWEADLRERVNRAISLSKNLEDFVTVLEVDYGVEASLFGANGKPKESFSYSFTDMDGKARKKRSRSFGTDFTVESLERRIKANGKATEVSKPIETVEAPVEAPVNQTYRYDRKKYQEQLNQIINKQEIEKFNKLSREYDVANQSRKENDKQYG